MSDLPNVSNDETAPQAPLDPQAIEPTAPESAPFVPTIANSPAAFNLVIAPSDECVKHIMADFGLLHPVRLDQIPHLPTGGPARGEALNRYLLDYADGTPTLVVLQEEVWIKALLENNEEMAGRVWRAIESKLLGHHTERQRILLIVSENFKDSCRAAIDRNALQFWTQATKIPAIWKAKRTASDHSQVKEKTQSTKTKETPQPRKPPVENQKKTDRPERVQRTAPVPNLRLQDDLYLLVKGQYVSIRGENYADFQHDVKAVIRYHMGVSEVQDGLVVSQLFKTLIGKSHRGYWGGFNLLQDIVMCGAQSPKHVASSLFGWIAGIPVRDSEGREITQPVVDARLKEYLSRTLG